MGVRTGKPTRSKWNGLLLSRVAMFCAALVAAGWIIWSEQQEPAYSGEALRLMIQNIERTHALAVRGNDTEGQCVAARLLGKLYRRAEDTKASEAWNQTANAVCDRDEFQPPDIGT